MKYKENFIAGNISKGKFIQPEGVVAHHIYLLKEDIIAMFTKLSGVLSDGREFKGVSAHCVIWKDGSRTIFATDIQRTWHAGMSEFKGKKYCNNFMLGVEFHGNTNKEPLTQNQIGSFIEWFIPRKEKFNIGFDYVTDHRAVRMNFIDKFCSIIKGRAYYNDKLVAKKVDLNPVELNKLLKVIKQLYTKL